MAECDVDDILCQIKVLQSLNDLKAALGNESFLSKFPELTNLPEKLTTEISSQRENLKEALTKCGNIGLEVEDEFQGIPFGEGVVATSSEESESGEG